MTDNRTTELLPCPFCGGEAEVYEMQYGADGQYSVFGVFCVDDSNSELIGLSKYQHGHFIDNFPTEAEAIAAWNARAERGTLTAEQVREAIERNFGKVAVLDDGGPVEWRDDWVCKVGINYKAIADELNVRAERTCHNTHENRWFKCSACGYGFTDLYAEDESDINEQPRYCPNCGAKVVDA